MEKERECVVGFFYELLIYFFMSLWIGLEKGVIVGLMGVMLVYNGNVEISNFVEYIFLNLENVDVNVL